jgi:AcrR family transcriptional regulator
MHSTANSPAKRAAAAAPPGAGARERLLHAADDLFYQRGIRNVGIDELIATAGIAKGSLYKHFPSKDELVAEYLRRRDESWRAWFQSAVESRATTPEERLIAVFDVLGEWLASADFRGCAFQNASVELADRSHPAQAVAAANKRAVRGYLAHLAREAGRAEPEALAEQLALIAEGAIVLTVVEGTSSARARAARAAATTLLNAG